ncbi:MAG: hypothetical protein AAF125_03515 [Chloroflexota bacterium]
MAEKQQEIQPMERLLKLLARADEPFDQESVAMDCNDGCEEIAQMAERVSQGEALDDIFPAYADHLDQIGCCKEEFDALVSVLKAEEIIDETDIPSSENE